MAELMTVETFVVPTDGAFGALNDEQKLQKLIDARRCCDRGAGFVQKAREAVATAERHEKQAKDRLDPLHERNQQQAADHVARIDDLVEKQETLVSRITGEKNDALEQVAALEQDVRDLQEAALVKDEQLAAGVSSIDKIEVEKGELSAASAKAAEDHEAALAALQEKLDGAKEQIADLRGQLEKAKNEQPETPAGDEE